MRRWAWGALLVAGCGFSPNGAAPAQDGPIVSIDAPRGSGGSDAAIDAGSGSGSAHARAAQDLLLGAGRLSVGTITVDVQLGGGPQATRLSAGSATIQGQTVIQP